MSDLAPGDIVEVFKYYQNLNEAWLTGSLPLKANNLATIMRKLPPETSASPFDVRYELFMMKDGAVRILGYQNLRLISKGWRRDESR